MQYSQVKAMFAITKASLRAISRSPSAIVFSFVFPFIFILVFGFIGQNGGRQVFRVVLADGSDTSNPVYHAIRQSPAIRLFKYDDPEDLKHDIRRGAIAGTIGINKSTDASAPYSLSLKSATSSNDQWPQLKAHLESILNEVSNRQFPGRPSAASFDFDFVRDITEVRQYKTIDFILPGQLGFSLLSSGVFGVAFMFFNLRNTLVLKRFFATPITRTYIILGEALSRVIFQMITAIVIIAVGYYVFGFTLVNHFQTFMEMLLLSFLGLLVFMGFGFIVSGLARNDSSIPPFANLITLPQFLLGGTFFSVDAFPWWLQPVSRALPLTHLNTAMRAVAFEGQSLWAVKTEIGILLAWGIVVYAIAVRVFRWE